MGAKTHHINIDRRMRSATEYNDDFWESDSKEWVKCGEWRLEIRGLDNPAKTEDWGKIRTLAANRSRSIAIKLKNVDIAAKKRKSWEERKLEGQLKEINDCANKGNLKPAWDFLGKLRKGKKGKSNKPIKTENGREAQDEDETTKRWVDWTKNWAYTLDTRPKMQHIHPSYWDQLEHNNETNNGIPHETNEIRKHSYLLAFFRKYPECQNMLTDKITETEVKLCIDCLAKNKSHGTDGIPAEAYIACNKLVRKNITLICNNIGEGREMPTEWREGAAVHIYKHKGTHKNATTTGPSV